MSFLRTSRNLPRFTAMQLSPWLLVGSALILGLAISFWAVKNARLERENMSRNLLERAGALMWAMEGGARAGAGMQSGSYLQFILEETAKQPGIIYMAVVSQRGEIMAHSNRVRIGEMLYPPEGMEGLFPSGQIEWRMVDSKEGSVFEAFKVFAPVPSFPEHMGHGRGHGSMMRFRGKGGLFRGMRQEAPGRDNGAESRPMPPPFQASPPREDPNRPGVAPLSPSTDDYIIVIGLDMTPFKKALTAGERSIAFTAFLVGLLGVGGFISLFWAQSYKLSRRLLLDASAIADKVISSLPLGLLFLDASGKITEANSVAEHLLGYPEKGLIGLKPQEIQGADWAGIAGRLRDGELVLEEEHTLLLPAADKEGESRAIPVSISAARVLNDEGESLGIVYLLRDLREVKRLQEELRRNERLSTLGNMAARVAHEIRNPLSSIKGFATYLGSRHQNDTDAEAARTMISEVDRLNRVVSELLDFARPSNLVIAPADMRQIFERAIRLVEMDASAKGVKLALDTHEYNDNGPVPVAVDAERITQALLNLLINAVQATDRDGTVTLSLAPAPGNQVLVRIADTGRGMSREVLSQVFNPYFTTKASGTGLGLSIVSKIIEDHNGTISMHSVEGEGTSVLLRLPAAERIQADTSGD